MKIQIAVNTKISSRKLRLQLPQGMKKEDAPPELKREIQENQAEITYRFKVLDLTPGEFLAILRGPCAVTNIFENEKGRFHRHADNFKSADWFGADFDNDNKGEQFTIENALADPFIKNNALFLYTSPSHTDKKHKFRVVFLLPKRVTTKAEFEKITKPIVRHYPQADQACWNVSRFYYGMGENPIVHKIKKMLKIDNVKKLIPEKKAPTTPKQPMTRHESGPSVPTPAQENVLENLLAASATTAVGNRSEADFSLICWMLSIGYSKVEIQSTVSNIGKFAEQGEQYFEATYKNAREKIDNEPKWQPTRKASKLPPPDTSTENKTKLSARERIVIDRCYRDEKGLSELFVDLSDGKARYCHESKNWYYFNGTKWEGDLAKLAEQTIFNKMLRELANTIDACKLVLMQGNPTEEEKKSLEANMKMIRTKIKKLNTAKGQTAISRLSWTDLTVKETAFDSNIYELNLKNGIYNLKNNTFGPHNAESLCRKVANVEYNKNAQSPRFDLFMDQVLEGNAEMLRYIYQVIGVALSGESPEEITFLIGRGANGKSTLTTVIRGILGEYSMALPAETFVSKRFGSADSNQYYIARFQGARFVLVSEGKPGYIDMGFVKSVTGGGDEKMVGRHPGGRPFEINPTHTIMITANTEPRFDLDGTKGARRRPKFVEFNHVFEGEGTVRRNEIDAILAEEYPGILNKFISGWQDYIECGGFKHPPELLEHTQSVLTEGDIVSLFVRERTEFCEGARVLRKDLYRDFIEFCTENEYHNPWHGQIGFNRALSDRGFSEEGENRKLEAYRTGQGMVWSNRKMKIKFNGELGL